MSGIWTMGEIIVEIMRPRIDMEHSKTGEYIGPFPSGAPAIFADTAARLGIKTGIIGGVGADDFGEMLIHRLESDGVDCRFVKRYSGSTGVAFVMYRQDGSRKFIFHIKDTPAAKAIVPDNSCINPPDFFHIMGCSLTVSDKFRKEILKAMEAFLSIGAKISFDPNIRPELLRGDNLQQIIKPILKNCSVIMPGVEELLLIANETSQETAISKLFKNDTLDVIALKRGAKGCTIITRDITFDIPAYQVKQVDPTGAGDCFDAAFLAGLVQGKPYESSAKMASAAGALNAAAFGPMSGNISMQSIEELMKQQGEYWPSAFSATIIGK